MPDRDDETAIIERWGHGQCHALTIALHERTGWPIVTLHNGFCTIGSRYLDQCGELLHSGVTLPDGQFLDIRGLHTQERLSEIESVYLDNPQQARWSSHLEPDLLDLAEMLDRHDLLSQAIDEAHLVVDRYLTGLTGIEFPLPEIPDRTWLMTGCEMDGSRPFF